MSANNKGGEGRGGSESLKRPSTAAIASMALFLTGCFGGGKTETTPGPAPTVAGEATPGVIGSTPSATPEGFDNFPPGLTDEEKAKMKALDEQDRAVREKLRRFIEMPDEEWTSLSLQKQAAEVFNLRQAAAIYEGNSPLTNSGDEEGCQGYYDQILKGEINPVSSSSQAMVALLKAQINSSLAMGENGMTGTTAKLNRRFVERVARFTFPHNPNLKGDNLAGDIGKLIQEGFTTTTTCKPALIAAAEPTQFDADGFPSRRIAYAIDGNISNGFASLDLRFIEVSEGKFVVQVTDERDS